MTPASVRSTRCLVLTAVGIAVMTILMLRFAHWIDVDSALLFYLLAVVVSAIVTTRALAVAAAVVCWLLADYLFAPPRGALSFEDDRLVELAILLAVAVLVAFVVDAGARHRETAHRHQREAQLLSNLAAIGRHEMPAVAVLAQVKAALGMTWVRLVRAQDAGPAQPVAQVGEPDSGPQDFCVDAGNGLRIEGAWAAAELVVSEGIRRAIADAIGHLWNEQHVAEQLARARRDADLDRLRNDLLAAVSHDLRTPLAGIKANASALAQPDTAWPDEIRAELLASIEESADHLTEMVSNLLAMNRLRAGALSAQLQAVQLYEVVSRALVGLGDHDTIVEVSEDLPLVSADPALLERVVANLVMNARQHGEAEVPVTVEATTEGASGVRLAVVDHGPGIQGARWEEAFQPFQRLDDAGTGLGLGLAIAQGFSQAMGACLIPSHTPGGGLTMTLTLVRAR
jgi:K+-sensing histidine kinase KdpD